MGEDFYAIVILCGNLSGKGYGNVLEMVSLLKTKNLYFLNKLSEYIKIKNSGKDRVADNAVKSVAVFITLIPKLIFFLFLPLFLLVTLLSKFKD